jgi:transcriptional antiterminator NusG
MMTDERPDQPDMSGASVPEEPEQIAVPPQEEAAGAARPDDQPSPEEVAPPPDEPHTAGGSADEVAGAEEQVDPPPVQEAEGAAETVTRLDPEPPVEPDVSAPDVAEAPTADERQELEVVEAGQPDVAEPPEAAPEDVLSEAEAPAVAPAPKPRAPRAAEKPQAPEEAPVLDGDPFAGPGDWYVIHTYAGYENKVKTNLESRINTMQMQEKIFDVVIPMEDVMEIKGGRKQVVQKKVFPGYLLVKMTYDDDSWYVVRNTPGVTGFVSSGTGQKPTPLSRREVEKILAVKKEEAKPTFRLDFEEGDVVRIISGPFADFNGTIDEINVDQSKVKVLVNIFDRETPVELSFDQVARV